MPAPTWTCEKCGKSFGDLQDAIDCEQSHKPTHKGYRSPTIRHIAKASVSDDSSIHLTHESELDAVQWGCHINVHDSCTTKRDPDWYTPQFSSDWGQRGLVVWNRTIQMVARMRAADALELLTELQTKSLEEGITVGENRIVHRSDGQLGQKPPYTLVNKISLDAIQSHKLLSFLKANEPLLQKMVQEDHERWHQALRQAYMVLIKAYWRRMAEEHSQSQL